ncbi:cytochrome P450 6k1-like [Diabrotica virgifera virgifera]|uniref:Cytochrome P450 6k1-like n=1 Tax=Diabrotica virgifera virgifera TaxID=50390 RepID=A0ABM5KYQ1_DIAVI|nr:cytochrome P450 6k1-like [Diabrotica virgifera virgifera]
MLLTSSWIMDTTIFIAFISSLVYKYFTRNFDYWKKRKILYPKPIPLFGNFYEVFTFKMTIHERLKELYDQIDAPYFGIFIVDEPFLVIKDPKLIKDVLIKDFNIFCNRTGAVPPKTLMAKAVFFLKNPEWKQVRVKLTPVFTSAMLKNLHSNCLIEVCNCLVGFLNKNKGIIDGKRAAELFSSELIMKFVYGVNPQCFYEKSSQIQTLLKKISEFNIRNGVIQNLYFIKPSWVMFFQLNFIPESMMKFFEGVFKQTMEARSQYDGKPQTFVDFANKGVREKQSGKEDVLEYDMSIGTAISFLIAGKDTMTTQISFTLYEIAMNESIQTKLRNEIKENVKKFGGITYEGVHQNKYLEMCIYETARKYPAVPFVDRVPIANYKFQGTDSVVEKGVTVLIPSYALHRDEKYYPHSEVYDPERFREDITSEGLTNIPFGAGPRSCIGKRLGILSLLVALSYIVLNFNIEKCPETPSKIEFDTKSFTLGSKKGLPLKITPIIAEEKV